VNGFLANRWHVTLSPEQNLAVDEVCPITAMVKAKASKCDP